MVSRAALVKRALFKFGGVMEAAGFLPYTLKLDFHVVRVCFPRQFEVEVAGDLLGKGRGRLQQLDDQVAIDFELAVEVTRPLLRILSLLVRPVIFAQHRWVMNQGQIGLNSVLRQQIGNN